MRNWKGKPIPPLYQSPILSPREDAPEEIAPRHVFLGIDPGKEGGMAWLTDKEAYAVPLPLLKSGEVDTPAVLSWFRARHNSFPQKGAIIGAMELLTGTAGARNYGPVCPVCKKSPSRNPGPSMFQMGISYGILSAGCALIHLLPEKPAAHQWQADLGIDKRRKEETTAQWKSRLKWNANRLYSRIGFNVSSILTLKTADALLLALWVQRKYRGTA